MNNSPRGEGEACTSERSCCDRHLRSSRKLQWQQVEHAPLHAKQQPRDEVWTPFATVVHCWPLGMGLVQVPRQLSLAHTCLHREAAKVGAAVGELVGECVGVWVGVWVGWFDGSSVVGGSVVGESVGVEVGERVGWKVGSLVGVAVGACVEQGLK